MEITFILPGRGFSGGVRVTVCMASELIRRGHDVKILYKKGDSSLRAWLWFFKTKLGLVPRDWVAQFEGESGSFRRLAPEILGRRDLVISVGPDCVEEMMKLPSDCGFKLFYVHGLTMRNSRLREAAWHTKVSKIAVSNYVYQEMLNSGVDDVIAVVPNGIDTSEYFPDGPEIARNSVGTAYSTHPAKDHKSILAIFARLHELCPDLSLVCFGSGPRPSEMLPGVIYKRLPTVAKARKIYSRCAVWFLASLSEGFPAPPLEAMACGCAVVTTDCGGPNDYIKSGFNGIVVEKKNPVKMVQEIINILDDDASRKKLVENGLRTVREMTWSCAAGKMEETLEKIISGQLGELVIS